MCGPRVLRVFEYEKGLMGLNYKLIEEDNQVDVAIQELFNMGTIGFDTETDGLDCYINNLILLQLGNEDKQFLFDMRKISPSRVAPILESSKVAKVTCNGAFDYLQFKRRGVEPEPLFDIGLNEKILLSGKIHPSASGYFSLKALTFKYLNEDLSKLLQLSFSMDRAFTTKHLKYGAMDVINPCRILKKQVPILKKAELLDTARLETDAIPAFADMEYNGFYLDAPSWEGVLDKVNKRILMVTKLLNPFFSKALQTDIFGDPIINYGASSQLLFALRKIGNDIPNTDKKSIMFLRDKELSELLLELAALRKASTSFGKNYLKNIHPVTNRVHPHINQIGAATGRVSMSKPNLQQQIKKDINEEITGKDYRGAWRAQDGGYIIKCDYSGEELLIMAEISGEDKWIDALQAGKDLHAVTALDIFDTVCSKTKNSEIRDVMKEINFGTPYGMHYFKLIELYKKMGKDISNDEAKGILKKYFEAYPKIKTVLHDTASQSITQGFTTTIGGRRRYFEPPPNRISLNPDTGDEIFIPLHWTKENNGKLEQIQRQGKNHRIQGTGGDIIKRALYLMRKKIKKYDVPLLLVNQVHDEIVLEYNGEDPEWVAKEFMEKPMLEAEAKYLKLVPPAVETSIGRVWIK